MCGVLKQGGSGGATHRRRRGCAIVRHPAAKNASAHTPHGDKPSDGPSPKSQTERKQKGTQCEWTHAAARRTRLSSAASCACPTPSPSVCLMQSPTPFMAPGGRLPPHSASVAPCTQQSQNAHALCPRMHPAKARTVRACPARACCPKPTKLIRLAPINLCSRLTKGNKLGSTRRACCAATRMPTALPAAACCRRTSTARRRVPAATHSMRCSSSHGRRRLRHCSQ